MLPDNRTLAQHFYRKNPNGAAPVGIPADADRSMVPENHLGSQMEVETAPYQALPVMPPIASGAMPISIPEDEQGY